jgi:serine protease Do
MNRRCTWVAVALIAGVCSAGWTAERGGGSNVAESPREKSLATQRSGPQESQGLGGRFRNWWRRDNPYLKNNASVKAAYHTATAAAAKSTVQVLTDGKVAALGTIVDPHGYIVTKASLLEGKLACRIAGRDPLDATLVGVSLEHDLALLKVPADDLTAVAWRTEPAVPGTLVAAAAPDGDAIGIGVISAEPRSVPGPRRQNRRRGWLGVSLGGGDAGVGIVDVRDGSAASKGGLQPGDEVQTIDGQAMRSTEQIIETIGNHGPGEKLTIIVKRGDEQVTKEVQLDKPPQNAQPEDQWGGGPFSERREGFPTVLPHDTAVLPQQCGGPLVDMDGKVVGVNIARALRVTTYAIPADIVQQFVAATK